MKRILLILPLFALLFAAVSCTESKGGDSSVSSFSKEIRVEDPIAVSLAAGSIQSTAESAEAVKKAVKISPAIDFDVDIVDGQTICLYPKQKLDYNTVYKVTANFGRLAGVKGRNETLEVKTLAPVLLFDFSTLNVTGEDVYGVQVDITSSDILDSKYLESGFSVKGVANSISWSHSEDGLKHSATVSGLAAGSSEQKAVFEYSYPKYSAEGSRKFTIPEKGKFYVLDSETRNQPFGFFVTFSAPLADGQNFNELVQAPGKGKMTYSVNGNVLAIYPSVKAEKQQYICIAKNIRSKRGATLTEDFARFFDVPSDEPSVRFQSNGVILPSKEGMNLYFQAINYAKAEVRVKQIYENNILQFLQSNSLDDKYCYTDNVARTVLDTTIVLGETNSQKLRNLSTYGLNIANLVNVQRGAIYRVEIRGREPLIEFKDDHWESDYYFGTYSDYEDRVRNVLVSDLSVIAKGSGKGEYSFFVTDIITAAPVNGAKVYVYNSVNQLIAEGSTGSGGRFDCKVSDDTPRTAIISHGADKSYVSLSGGSAISLSSFDVDGTSFQQGQKGYVFGERGVWRPGDEIHLTFVSMLDEGVLPANHPVTASLISPQGQTMKTIVNNQGHQGMYSFTFQTEPSAQTGNWEAVVTAGGQSWRKTVKVETVKPNNIVINLSLNDKPAVPAKSVRGDISAKWLVGNPAKGLETRVSAALSRGKTSFSGYEKYTFEDRSRDFTSQEIDVYKGTTDSQGQASFNVSIPASKKSPGMMTAVFTTRVFEKSGENSVDNCQVTLSPFDTYIGISAPEKENDWGEMYVDKARPAKFSIAALDYKGGAAPSTEVEVELYKMGWSWWWSSTADLANYSKDSYNEPYKIFRKSVSGGAATFTEDFTSEESGFYFIRVTDLKGGHAASKVVMVTSSYENSQSGASDAAVKLPMTLDKDSYIVGQTARLTIPSTSGAKALVSVEKGERVIKSFWVDCKGDQTEIQIPIESGMTPNAFASVTLIQPYGNTGNDAPIRMFGVERIKVEDQATHLEPVIDIAGEVRPESEVSFSVKEKNGREMSYVVAIVDEGLLSLTRFKTPDPWNYFYAPEALSVKTWDLYDLVIGAYGARMEQIFAIGGDGENSDFITPNTQAERFKPVSLFLGPFTVKAKGTDKHTVNIPQYIGSVRAMVIATDGSSMGSTEKKVSVTKPVMVKAALPRVIGTDEEVTLPVTVMTTKDGIGSVNVEVSASGPLSVSGSATASTSLQKAGENIVYFTLKAGSEEGIAKIKTVAKGAGDTSTEELEIDVRDPNPMTANSKVMLIEGGKSIDAQFALAGKPGTNSVSVEASTIPPVDIDYRLGYLTGYPHGCLEQTVSAVFPQLYLGSLMDLDAKASESCATNIEAAINKLNSFAIPAGGMTYWPGTASYSGASEWATIYATHFMVEAQKAGYAVPAALKKSNISYLKTVASGGSYAAVSRAYACYVLALAGNADRSAMNRLRGDIDKIPEAAAWYLAGAYALDGKSDVARQVAPSKEAGSASNFDRFSSTFDSEERVLATAAMVFTKLGNSASAFKCVEKLATRLNDRKYYMSTQSTAWALNAVADYVKANNCDPLNVSITSGSDKITLKSSKAVAQGSLNENSEGTLNMKVTNNSKAPAYVVVSSRGIPEKGEEVAISNGIKMYVEYKTPDGAAVNPFTLDQGTDFISYLHIINLSQTEDYTNVAISQIFPSGWEIRVDRIDGFYQDIRDDRVYSYLFMKHNAHYVIETRLTATYPGRFYLPAATAEAMYDSSVSASTVGGWCIVQ